MKIIILTNDETWMLKIALENELEKYCYYYEPDERTELNVSLLQKLICKLGCEPESRLEALF